MFVSAESEMVRLVSREIIFTEFQPIYDHYTSTLQTDRQLALAISRSAIGVAR